MTENKRWTVTVEEDPETKELVIPFSPDMLAQVGWDFGDIILWKDNQNGSFTLSKQKVTDNNE
jgi:hypothetical protein